MYSYFIPIYFSDVYFFFIEIFILIIIMILILLFIYISIYIKSIYINRLIIELITPFVIILCFFFFNLFDIDIIFLDSFRIDSFTTFIKLLFVLFFYLCLYGSLKFFFLERIYIYEYPILLLFVLLANLILISSYDLFVIYLVIELQNLSFYVLASLKRYSNFSTEAGLKYFLLGSFSSGLLLYGLSLLYGLFGTLNLFTINLLVNYYISELNIFILSILFILSGLIFKLGGAPFHWWVPDVYQGSPTIVTMIFSVLPKLVYVFLIFKLYIYLFFVNYVFINSIFLFVGILSIFIGVFNAMYQFNIKRFFAYSAIVNVGYVFASLSLCSFFGFYSAFYFIICYLFSISTFFLFLLNIRRRYMLREFSSLFELSLLNKNKVFMILLSIIFFSLAGIPPFIGFFGKFFVYISLLKEYNYILLSFLMILSVVSAFYYFRIVRFLFFTNVYENENLYITNNLHIFILLIFINVLFLFFFDFLSELLFKLLIMHIYY